MESRKPTISFSSLPGLAVEVSKLEFLLDLLQQVPARGTISNMVARRATFVLTRVELANDVSFTVFYGPDKGSGVPLGGEGFGALKTTVVNAELDGLDAGIILSE